MYKIITIFLCLAILTHSSKCHVFELVNDLINHNQRLNFTLESNIFNEKYQNISTWSFGNFIRPENKSVEFDLRFFSPTKPGTYPVIIFLTGLDGMAPSFFYIDFMKKLANETQSIIICYDKLHFPRFPDIEEKWFEQTLNWTLNNIDTLFNSKNTPLNIKNKVYTDIKTNGISLMSHSAAGHPVVSYLVKTCGLVKSLILLDPVDGYDPFGLFKIFVTNPPKQLPFVVPTLIIETGLDNVSNSPKVPPCAPANLSNSRFYDSLSGPTWMLNFTGYGHADLMDDIPREYLTKLVCITCQKNCLFDLYRSNLVKALSLFIKGVNEKNQIYLNAIQNPTESKMFDDKIEILSVYKTNGYDVLNTGAFCNHDNSKRFFYEYFKIFFIETFKF